MRAWACQSDSELLNSRTSNLKFQVNLTPGRRLFLAKIAGSDSDRLAGWLMASLSAYQVLAQQDVLCLCQLNSNQPPFKAMGSSSPSIGLECAATLQPQTWRPVSLLQPADISFRAIHVDAHASNVMVTAGCPAGPVPDVHYPPPGKALYIYCNYCPSYNSLVV